MKDKPTRTALASGRKELQEIVKTCEAISERKFNPFFLDVKLGIDILRRYFPFWERFEDHCLDAHTINSLSEVVRLQNTQLRFQSSRLYADPEFLAGKVERMSEKRLAETFLQSWHPLTELEQLTDRAVSEALDYWTLLLPIEERWTRKERPSGKGPGIADSSLLVELGIHGEEFDKQLVALWNELRRLHESDQKPVEYWRFVRGASYGATVQRAYFVSFLVTYGYAKLYPDGNTMTLIPVDPPLKRSISGSVSFPIPIPKEP